MDILKKLFAPLNYLRIYHRQKAMVDFLMPLVFSSIICIIYVSLPKPFTMLGGTSVITSLNGFVQIIAGFFVAALAAIATFPNENMDEVTDGIPLKLKGEDLTRRQFLSYMFGYLSFMGFFLVLVGISIQALAPSLQFWFTNLLPQYVIVFKLIFIFIYFFIFSTLLFTTLYGLYYLTEKVHKRKSKFLGEIGDASEDNEPEDFE